MKLPKKLVPFAFVFLVACPLSLVMAFAVTVRANGLESFDAHFFAQWMNAFVFGFGIAYPTALILVPQARRIIHRIS
jgi:hypothetical protein